MPIPFLRPEIIRPPSEWRSYFLPITNGCSNNTCTFCNNYGSRLQIRELNDIKREIDAIALYIKNGITLPDIPAIVYLISQEWDGKGLFLQDSDALVYPFSELREILYHINQKLPFVERVATYATAQDILRRSSEELEELASHKLGIVHNAKTALVFSSEEYYQAQLPILSKLLSSSVIASCIAPNIP